jgi:hypothetical protein
MSRMIRRSAGWVLASVAIAGVLAAGAAGLSGGSSTSILVEPMKTVSTPNTPNTGLGTARTADSCGFTNPCNATSALNDSIERIAVAQPPSPNPNACWYCFTKGPETTYTQWFIGVDYATPVATYKINTVSAGEPTLRLMGSQARSVLTRHGYDLAYASPLTGITCISPQTCPSHPASTQFSLTSTFTMSGPPASGDTWEIVPVIAERWYAHTDNSLDHPGETRSDGVQKVVISLEEIVLH